MTTCGFAASTATFDPDKTLRPAKSLAFFRAKPSCLFDFFFQLFNPIVLQCTSRCDPFSPSRGRCGTMQPVRRPEANLTLDLNMLYLISIWIRYISLYIYIYIKIALMIYQDQVQMSWGKSYRTVDQHISWSGFAMAFPRVRCGSPQQNYDSSICSSFALGMREKWYTLWY